MALWLGSQIYTHARARGHATPPPKRFQAMHAATPAGRSEALHVVFRAWQYGIIRLKPAKCLISLTYLLNIITVMRLMTGIPSRIGPPSQAGKGIGEGISPLGNLLADRRQIRCTAQGQFIPIYTWVKL